MQVYGQIEKFWKISGGVVDRLSWGDRQKLRAVLLPIDFGYPARYN